MKMKKLAKPKKAKSKKVPMFPPKPKQGRGMAPRGGGLMGLMKS